MSRLPCIVDKVSDGSTWMFTFKRMRGNRNFDLHVEQKKLHFVSSESSFQVSECS